MGLPSIFGHSAKCLILKESKLLILFDTIPALQVAR